MQHYSLRARFGEIIAEFLPPARRSDRVLIFCTGMPSGPSGKGTVLRFLAKKGYWVFLPRYRGSWESSGSFLKISPEKDIKKVMDGIARGVTSIADGKKYKIKNPQFYLMGCSFGGPAALLLSRDPRVRKVLALSPVVDWKAMERATKGEKIDEVARFTKAAFGEGYRGAARDWEKLKRGMFYNPAADTDKINGEKVFIIHAKNDTSVAWRPVQKFAKRTGSRLLLLKQGGHFSGSIVMRPALWKKIRGFFSER